MENWIRKKSELLDENWYTHENKDEVLLRPWVGNVMEQIEEENKLYLQSVIHKLGFKEAQDYNRKIVLRSNITIRKKLSKKQVSELIKRLKKK